MHLKKIPVCRMCFKRSVRLTSKRYCSIPCIIAGKHQLKTVKNVYQKMMVNALTKRN